MRVIFLCLLGLSVFFLTVSPLIAMVSGPCSNCHTMHNSQNGLAVNFDGDATPNRYLTRGTCVGCHAQGTTKIVSLGDSQIPQVMHTDTTDLAGGNFYYIFGPGGSDSKGHNVIDLGEADQTLENAPGHFHSSHLLGSKLTCAGTNGCHGTFGIGFNDPYISIDAAHHSDDSSITGETAGTSYRFLRGVVGLEATDWENRDSEHHNEYHGHTHNEIPNCGGCHAIHGPVSNPGMSIASLCVRCHLDMHRIDTNYDEVWIRHPSDIVIPDEGEYQSYTTYNVEAPVGRVTIPDIASDVVTPGVDVVTCLSCHMAHGSNYPDMLRWDYSQIIASGGDSQNGCFICHSEKDE